MQRISVSTNLLFGRAGVHYSTSARKSYLISEMTYHSGFGLMTVISSPLGRTLKQILRMNVRQSVQYHCYRPNNVRFQSSLRGASSRNQSVHSVEATKDTFAPTLFDGDDASVRLSDATSSNVSNVDPSRELIIHVNGSSSSVKAVELYSLIRKFNTEEILCLVEHSGLVLDKTHLALSLKRLFYLSTRTHNGSSSAEIGSLSLDRRFKILSVLLAKKARYLEPSVAADMLTFFVHFGMTSSDMVLKIYMHVVMKHMNNLALDELATLTYNLDQLGPSPQTEIFLKAINVLCNTRQHQLKTLSVEHAIFLLDAFGSGLDYVNRLFDGMWLDRLDITRPHTAVAVIRAIGRTFVGYHPDKVGQPVRRHRKLESWCITTVLQNMKKLEVGDAISLLISLQHLRLYHGELLSAIGKQFSCDVAHSLTDRISIWSSLVDLGYLHSSLSDSIVSNVTIGTLQSLSAVERLTLLRLLAEKNCYSEDIANKTEFYQVRNILQVILKLADDEIMQLCTDTYVLAPDAMLDACLYLVSMQKPLPDSLINFILHKVDSCLTSEISTHSFPITDKLLLLLHLLNDQACTKDNRVTDAIMSRARVQQGKRPESCITPAFKLIRVNSMQSHVTESGFHADHLVCGSETGQPSSTVVMCWRHGSHYWRNTNKLQCIPRLYARTMQNTDRCRVVTLNADVWLTMAERERLEYLKHKLMDSDLCASDV